MKVRRNIVDIIISLIIIQVFHLRHLVLHLIFIFLNTYIFKIIVIYDFEVMSLTMHLHSESNLTQPIYKPNDCSLKFRSAQPTQKKNMRRKKCCVDTPCSSWHIAGLGHTL